MVTRIPPVDSAGPNLYENDAVTAASLITDVTLGNPVKAVGVNPTTPRLPDDVVDASLVTYDVRAGGVSGGGVADEGAALNALLSAQVGKTIVVPSGFVIRTTVPIDVPTGTRLRAYGASLKNACAGTTDRLLRFIGVTDCVIEGLELNGDKASFGSATEHRHNVYLENADDITFRDVYSHNAKGDGFYVGDNNTVANYCTNVALEGCMADANHRNGLSVIAVDGFKASDCRFVNSSGTSPQAGVDVEPNADATVINDVQFVNCTMSGNVGAGAMVALRSAPSATQRSVGFVNCEMSVNTNATAGRGLWLYNPTNVRVVGCQIRGNTAEGIYIDPSAGTVTERGTVISECAIAENGREGIQVYDIGAIKIIGCDIISNSQTSSNTRDGINITPTAAANDYQIIGCRFDGASQRYGLRTTTNAQKVTVIGNHYGTMGTGTTSLADQQGSRFRLDRQGVLLSNTTGGQAAIQIRENADTADRLMVRTDGVLLWGSGSATVDVRLTRAAAGVLGMNAQNVFRHGSGTTAQRPAAATAGVGAEYYDTTLGKPIWSTGAAWIDATGAAV